MAVFHFFWAIPKVSMKNGLFEIEFFYANHEPQHLELLCVLEETVTRMRKAGIVVVLKLMEFDTRSGEWPDDWLKRVIALPCIRRLRPSPERLIIARLRSCEEIAQALGFPILGTRRAIGLDVYRGLPGVEIKSAA